MTYIYYSCYISRKHFLFLSHNISYAYNNTSIDKGNWIYFLVLELEVVTPYILASYILAWKEYLPRYFDLTQIQFNRGREYGTQIAGPAQLFFEQTVAISKKKVTIHPFITAMFGTLILVPNTLFCME